MTSPIKAYKQYTINRAYKGETFFWGLMPQAGDTIVFEFDEPVKVKGFRLRSGNHEHPSDLLYNTSVEVLPDGDRHGGGSNGQATDGYVIVGQFDELGVAEGKLDADKLGLIRSVRLSIKSASKNWVIISEVCHFDGNVFSLNIIHFYIFFLQIMFDTADR